MKKLLFLMGLLISQAAIAQTSMLSEMSVVKDGILIEISRCEDSKCTFGKFLERNYLVSIKTPNGSISNKEVEEVKIQVEVLSKEKDELLKVTHIEKIKAGYFNEKGEFDLFFSKNRVTDESNYEKTFYVPVTGNKTYKLDLNEDTSINIKLK